MANTLFLRLEGPLQSWGERGRWSIRDSAAEPTKSGVIGLLGCALGVGDDATLRDLSARTRLGVRVDQPGTRLTDYHTIGGGYPEPALLTAEGKPKISSGRPHTEISLRDYLCDASFLVALWSADTALIDRLAHAVQHPVWPFFLGRKSCPPSRPVFAAVGTHPDVESAVRSGLEWPAETGAALRAVIETTARSGVTRRDHLLSRTHRIHGPRYVRDIVIVNQSEASP